MKYLIILLLMGCVKDQTPLSVRIVTYNVLVGGGYTDRWYGSMSKQYKHDRLPDILRIARTASPDIICFQEASEWGESGIMEQISSDLGLPYHLYDLDAWLATFSRYPISSYEKLSDMELDVEFWNVSWSVWGKARPRILITEHNINGQKLDVVNLHYQIMNYRTGSQVHAEEIRLTNSYLQNSVNPVILAGDFNDDRSYWKEDGWISAVPYPIKGYGEFPIGPDDILIKDLDCIRGDFTDLVGIELLKSASDHIPLYSEIIIQ